MSSGVRSCGPAVITTKATLNKPVAQIRIGTADTVTAGTKLLTHSEKKNPKIEKAMHNCHMHVSLQLLIISKWASSVS
jgi:hypothetical protein